jgi:hypothetical protein
MIWSAGFPPALPGLTEPSPGIEQTRVKLPATSIIAPEKLRDYVLSAAHPDGSAKAVYLAGLGYTRAEWWRLERDVRDQILTRDAVELGDSVYGTKYEILGPLTGPNGSSGWVRTIWILPWGQANPRLVTLVPMEAR